MYYVIDTKKEANFQTKRESFEELLKQFENGDLLIPSFVRSYQWKAENVNAFLKELVSGIYLQILLWKSNQKVETKETVLCTNKTVADRKTYTYLIDGQQRITTIYHLKNGSVVNGIDFKKFCITLDDGKVVNIHELFNKSRLYMPEEEERLLHTLLTVEIKIQSNVNVPIEDAAECYLNANTLIE